MPGAKHLPAYARTQLPAQDCDCLYGKALILDGSTPQTITVHGAIAYVTIAPEGGEVYYQVNGTLATTASPGYVPDGGYQVLGPIANFDNLSIFSTTADTSAHLLFCKHPGRHGHVVWPGGALGEDLVAFWKLNEAAGNQRLDSIGTIHLTETNGNVAQNIGKVLNAAEFVNDNKHLRNAAPTPLQIDINSVFTIWTWFYLDNVAGFKALIAKDAVGGTDWELWTQNNKLNWQVGAAAAGINGLVANTWYLAFGSYDGPASQAVLDVVGVGIASVIAANPIIGTYPLKIGYDDRYGTLMDGRVDAVGYIDRLLDDWEKTFLWNGGNGREWPW